MQRKNHLLATWGRFAILLLVVFLAPVAAKRHPNSKSQTYYLRLPFVHKLTSVPTPLEKHVSPSCEGTTFLLLDKRFRKYFFEKDVKKEEAFTTDPTWIAATRGGGFGLSKIVPAGYNPFGYRLTELGQEFLNFDGSLDCDIGRFLTSMRTRKRFAAIKAQWLEVLRVSKKGQCMRIYKSLQELIDFCLAAGFLD